MVIILWSFSQPKFSSFRIVMRYVNVWCVFCKLSVLYVYTWLHVDDNYEEFLAETDPTDSSGEVLTII